MLKAQRVDIAAIRVPVRRTRTLDAARVAELAESILELGLTTSIQVRADGPGFVLIEGLHRLEAMKALGETVVEAYLVQARKH
jgi:ParB-like chromosome segregation protein Spo0J